MKTLFVSAATIGFLLLAISATAGDNRDASVDASLTIQKADGSIEIPIVIGGAAGVQAIHVVIAYEGNIGSVEFTPSTFLHEPLMIPVRHNARDKTIELAIAATGRVVATMNDGTIGVLKLARGSRVGAAKVIHSEIADGSRKKDSYESPEYRALKSGAAVTSALRRELPTKTALHQSYPNPANPVSTIAFDLVDNSRVTLVIYDVAGRVVKRLADESMTGGPYAFEWDGRNERGEGVATGVYFYRLRAGSFNETRKLVLVK